MPVQFVRNPGVAIATAIAAPLMLIMLTAIASCSSGGDEETTVAANEPEPIDSRFATAEALVAHFNSLNTRTPPYTPEIVPLYYAENEMQRQILRIEQLRLPVFELNAAVEQQFDEPLFGRPLREVKPHTAATLTQHDGVRAQATFKEAGKRKHTLYLVKVGERWWVSCYSFEYDPRFKNADRMLPLLEVSSEASSRVVPGLISRVRAGEFRTTRDVLRAYIDAFADDAERNSGQYEAIFEQLFNESDE